MGTYNKDVRIVILGKGANTIKENVPLNVINVMNSLLVGYVMIILNITKKLSRIATLLIDLLLSRLNVIIVKTFKSPRLIVKIVRLNLLHIIAKSAIFGMVME